MDLMEAIVYLLDEFHLGDKIYTVRDRVCDIDPDYVGNSWEHPSVKRFQEAIATLDRARQ